MQPEIEILMATYNGAEYIEQQIESIQQQSVPNWKLSISDDCSSDGTLGILQRMANHDTRINIVSQGVKVWFSTSQFSLFS